MKLYRFIPKNIGIGPKVAIEVPIKIRSYAGYLAYKGAKNNRNTIINIGATDI